MPKTSCRRPHRRGRQRPLTFTTTGAIAIVVLLICGLLSLVDEDDEWTAWLPNTLVLTRADRRPANGTANHGDSEDDRLLPPLLLPPQPFPGLLAQLEDAIAGGNTVNQTESSPVTASSSSSSSSSVVPQYLGDTCRPTSQVLLHQSQGAKVPPPPQGPHVTTTPPTSTTTATTTSGTERWILQSMDDQGRPKTQGGDEFYVAYFDHDNNSDPTAVALVRDQHDGSYVLDFVATPMRQPPQEPAGDASRTRGGTLHIFFQYTCGLGRLSPPAKATWKSAAASRRSTAVPVRSAPPIRPFVFPALPALHSSSHHHFNLSTFAAVFFVGDSLFRQLARQEKGKRYYRPHTFIAGMIQSELNMSTLEPVFLHHLDSRHALDLVGQSPGGTSRPSNNQSDASRIAVLIGSSVWDILEPSPKDDEFTNHLAACRAYVHHVRRTYPNVTVLWKSPTAMHVHRLRDDCEKMTACNHRTRYMSTSRTDVLYRQQKGLMQELNVPFLDVYEASLLSAYQSRPGDGRHYTPAWNDKMSRYLFGVDDTTS